MAHHRSLFTFLFLLLLKHAVSDDKYEDLLSDTTARTRNKNPYVPPDYLIIGAGAGGIQMALFMEKHNISYLILEKETTVGSFWEKFPRFDELISVNKVARKQSQHFRYDWHSFLEAPLLMKDITTDYFPRGVDWHHYMAEVATAAKLKIEFGSRVASVMSNNGPCVTMDDGSERCARRRVFVGTGLVEKKERALEAIGGIPYSKVERGMAFQRCVCIIGNGNSGFEVAQNLYGIADRVIILGREPARLSAVTKYTGDVRAKYLQALENFNGKLLDTVVHYDKSNINLTSLRDASFSNMPLNDQQYNIMNDVVKTLLHVKRHNCELLVLATGFKAHVPGHNFTSQFPPMDQYLYTAHGNKNIHYVGWLMHKSDFRRGAGGFLSGFRYLTRNLFHHVMEKDLGMEYPHLSLNSQDAVITQALQRIQNASDLLILQDGVLVRDFIVPNKDGSYRYYEGITFDFHEDLQKKFGEEAISLYFAWGNGRSSRNVFESVYSYKSGGLMNIFLHPVIEKNGTVRHIQEDFDMEWSDIVDVYSIAHVLRQALSGNMEGFSTRRIYQYVRQEIERSPDDDVYAKQAVLRPELPLGFLKALWNASYYDFKEIETLFSLSEAAKDWIPPLAYSQNVM